MLADLQHNWLSSLSSPGSTHAAGLLGARDAMRFDIYRASLQANLTQALADTYPVIEKLVGPRFFEAAAEFYVQDHPSRHGDIHGFGSEFSNFLRQFDPARALPYLADVAQLEWLAHRAFHAADRPPLEIGALAAFTTEQLSTIFLDLHPSLFVMQSDYPIHRLWQVNQDHAPDTSVNLSAGGVNLAVYRDGLEIALMPFEASDFDFIAALRESDLAGACETTLVHHADFDPGRALHLVFSHGLIVGLTTGESSCTL